MPNINILVQEAEQAIEFIEDTDAKKILKQLRQIVVTQKIKETDPSLFSRLEKLMVYLSIVAFPNLSDQESAEVLRNYYLESYDIGVSMENRITAKLFFIPYLVRDELRELLKKSLFANSQKLGDLTIGQWIQEFERQFNVNTRNESAPIQFMTDNPKVYGLSFVDKEKLKEILHTYDYLLVSTLPAIGEDLKNLMNVVSQQKVGTAYESPVRYPEPRSVLPRQEFSGAVVTVNLPLLQALSKYENLGNQLITGERIKVKSQPEPVRPSLLYWLKYYRDELGIGQHSSVERGDFLFRSENGRKLSAPERERVSLILKSVEEDLPLSIDLERQEIIFPVFRDVVMSASTAHRDESTNNISPVRGSSAGSITGEPAFAWSPPPASMIPRDEPIRIPGGFTPLTVERNELPRVKAIGTPVFFVPKSEESEVRPTQVRSAGSTAPRQNENHTGQAFSAGEVSFSTGHVFPAEKEAAENRAVATKNVAPEPAQPQPVPQKFSSFRISPVSLGGRDPGDK